jgi:hypothetical protein
VRRSLADSFRPATPTAPPPDRAAALGGLLPPRVAVGTHPGTSPSSGLSVVPTADGDLPEGGGSALSAARGDAPAQVSLAGSTSVPVGDLARVRNVAVYLPVELLERFRRTARSREMTYADVLVEAASAHLAELPLVFDAAPPANAGMPSRTARRHPEPGVQVQLRLDGHQLHWLDAQVTRLRAPSRTALVLALLRVHLGAPR